MHLAVLSIRLPKGDTLANIEDQGEMRHFIRVCTVCSDEIDLQRKNTMGLKRVKLLWFITNVMLELIQPTQCTILEAYLYLCLFLIVCRLLKNILFEMHFEMHSP